VTETDAGKVLVREQDRDTPSLTASSDKHFGISDVVNEGLRLLWRQRLPGPCIVADGLDGLLAEARPPAPAENLAGFGVGVLAFLRG
jgi:hypothetical protein